MFGVDELASGIVVLFVVELFAIGVLLLVLMFRLVFGFGVMFSLGFYIWLV